LTKTFKLQKYLLVGIIFLFLGTFILPSTAYTFEDRLARAPGGNWLYVGGGGTGNYTYIQEAIDNAKDGDNIFVYSGWYEESIRINKSIVVCGEDRDTTSIVGKNTSEIVRIDQTSAELRGFTIESPFNEFINGIYISDCWSINITGNYVKSCEFGILITSSESLLISNNTFLNCSSGIVNVIVGNVTITQNRIDGNRKGSGVEVQAAMFKNYIVQNNITNNTVGVNLLFALFTVVQQNNLIDNQVPAYFTSSFFTKWQQNYWNNTRLLPKMILGQFGGMVIHKRIPFINFDWKPAAEAYDIQG
jgi:parallel beta-helix repeat protein